MANVLWATISTTNPMGQQVYEREIRDALSRHGGSKWRFEDVQVSSLRSHHESARRSPVGLLQRSPLPVALAIGGLTYRSLGLVHRFDLRLPPSPGGEVLTIHDLPPLRFPDEGRLPRSAAAGARRARLVICPSAFAADEVRNLLGVRRVEVIPYGLSDVFHDPTPAGDELLGSLGIRGAFVLHAAGATMRKNLDGLARAWAKVSRQETRLQLVLCGPPDPRREHAFRGLDRVVLAGRQSAEVVASLMARASAVVVPSVYEGFGLPALEAMSCGAPVVAASAAALPEVCGGAALLTEPTGEALAAALVRLVRDEALADDLRALALIRAARFRWDDAAIGHLAAYERCVA